MVEPDCAKATAFLRDYMRLTGQQRIVPWGRGDDTPPAACEFTAAKEAEAAAWMAGMQKARCNVYFHVNELRAGFVGKARESDVERVCAIPIDIDPRKGEAVEVAQAQMEATIKTCAGMASLRPTFIVHSGRGVQLHYLLAPGQTISVEEAKDIGKRAAAAVGGDAVHSVDHVMRLPGTVNFPNWQKAEAGYTPTLATLRASSGRTFTVEELRQLPAALSVHLGHIARPKTQQADAAGQRQASALTANAEGAFIAELRAAGVGRISDPADLDSDLLARLEVAKRRHPKFAARLAGDSTGLSDQSGSGIDFAIASCAAHARFNRLECAKILAAHMQATSPQTEQERLRHIARTVLRTGNGTREAFGPLPDPGERQVPPAGSPPAWASPGVLSRDDVDACLAAIGAGLWVVRGIIPGGDAVTLLFGAPGDGKSTVALDLAFHIGAGLPWLGRPVAQGPVVFICAEGFAVQVARLKALLMKHPEVENQVVLVPTPDLDLLKPDAARDIADAVRQTCAGIDINKAAAVFIDTLAAAATGDENSSEFMGGVIRGIKAIGVKFQAPVIVVHHTGKDQGRGPRGHGSLRAATTAGLQVHAPPDDGRFVKVERQKIGKEGEKFHFRIVPFEIGMEPSGSPWTVGTVEWTAPPPPATSGIAKPLARKPVKAEDDVLAVLAQLQDSNGGQPVRRNDLVVAVAERCSRPRGTVRNAVRNLVKCLRVVSAGGLVSVAIGESHPSGG